MYSNAVVLLSVAAVLVLAGHGSVMAKSLPGLRIADSVATPKRLEVVDPNAATSVSADTIENLTIVVADTVYILSDGSIVPENPSTTIPPFPTVSTGIPTFSTVPTGTSAPNLTPPVFPGRK
ncbi:hypothetical protein AND_001248 [Anopheles darlingi]|uniref:Secreted protein n=1 Tax=Anopheles darlingi TaxID=43151 RepID=W5JRE7_ANODA|nr:hypothetical protein AND_001248 [Anopheles darlingi]